MTQYLNMKKKKMSCLTFNHKSVSLSNSLIIFLLILICLKFFIENKLKLTTHERSSIAKQVFNDVPEECRNSIHLSKKKESSFKINVNSEIYPIEKIEKNLRNLKIKMSFGGISKSLENNRCQSVINAAIIVPFREREANLKVFLNNMHPILTRQKINYGIFLIEPLENSTFNRGILMNIGFKEIIKNENNHGFEWNCFIFHGI